MVSATKDPVKVRAGTIGAHARWRSSEPRIVRLDDLTDSQRRLVLALVAAAKEETATDVEAVTANAGGQANAHTAT